jgi:ABC-type transporter Mla maintaining outer membrane lipid asymmetry ATPase subunit MlaF
VGLTDALDEMPESLSGGMRRRVAIARALVSKKPKMLLYDEPTSDLDPVNVETICRLIIALSNAGKGFCMVTHEIIHALMVAERFLLLQNGTIVFDGDRSQLLDPGNERLKSFIGTIYWNTIQASRNIFSLKD